MTTTSLVFTFLTFAFFVSSAYANISIVAKPSSSRYSRPTYTRPTYRRPSTPSQPSYPKPSYSRPTYTRPSRTSNVAVVAKPSASRPVPKPTYSRPSKPSYSKPVPKPSYSKPTKPSNSKPAPKPTKPTKPSNSKPAPKPTQPSYSRPTQPSNSNKYNGICCLCNNCQDIVSGRGNTYVDQGVTCDLAYNLLFDSQSHLRRSNTCSALTNKYRSRCCDRNNRQGSVYQAPVPAPTINLKRGSEPKCEVCSNNKVPSKGHNIIAVLYHGTQTCRKLWEQGQTGNIQDKLCNPLQDFAFNVCGCH